MEKGFFSKSKKATGILVASVLLVGSLTATAFATQGINKVEKNVLITEKETSTKNNVASPDNRVMPSTDENNTASKASPVSEEQALDIARKALKTMFNADMTGRNLIQTINYSDSTSLENPKYKNAVWKSYWTDLTPDMKHQGMQLETTESHLVTIDASTGEILSISSQRIKFGEKPKGISPVAAKQMALDFVEQNNLVKGTVIKDAVAYDIKKAVIVKVELENGINAQVIVSSYDGKITTYVNDTDDKDWEDIVKAAKTSE